jgi:hypothetical protein
MAVPPRGRVDTAGGGRAKGPAWPYNVGRRGAQMRNNVSRFTTVVLVALAFGMGVWSDRWLTREAAAQGRLTELKRVDLGAWCPDKEVTISIEEIGPQRQSKHYHHAYSFAWMMEGSQRRMVEGRPIESFTVGDVVEEPPLEVSESEILTPTKVLLFRIADKNRPLTVRQN